MSNSLSAKLIIFAVSPNAPQRELAYLENSWTEFNALETNMGPPFISPRIPPIRINLEMDNKAPPTNTVRPLITKGSKTRTFAQVATNPAEEVEEAIEEGRVEGEASSKTNKVINKATARRATNSKIADTFPVGGRLYHFRKDWEFNSWAHSIIQKGLGWSWIRKPPRLKPFYQAPTPQLQEYVKDLLSKSVIRKVRSIRFQGRLFCVPKRNSTKKRVILDLSTLNKFIRCEKFRMLTVSQIRMLLPPGAVTISIDLSDAYWHIPIARRLTPFLGFKLGNQKFAFKALPFGLNIAPRIFTKLTDVVVHFLRQKGILVAAYLDDWLIWAKTATDCIKSAKEVMSFLESLGFRINVEKSRLTPASQFEWLGLQWDLTNCRLSLPSEKRKSIARQVRNLLAVPSLSRRSQERIMGSLQFASVTDNILKAKLKDINRIWLSRANSRLRDMKKKTPKILRVRLSHWSRAKNLSRSVPLQPPPPSMTIHTDASRSGWGGQAPHQTCQGTWSPTFQRFHINVLEAMAVLLSLKRLNPPRRIHIRLVLDNSAVVHCINRKGSRSGSVNQVMIAILSLARRRSWHLSAIHLAGVQNVVADALSRTKPLESEWSLDHRSFRWIQDQVPDLEVDLFATEYNTKIPLYVAPNLDPLALATDALALDWNQWKRIYLFPPVNCLMKVLQKLRSFTGKVALVAPDWPRSNWYPLLLELRLKKEKIPEPVLSQIVQAKTVFASSWLTKKLNLWSS